MLVKSPPSSSIMFNGFLSSPRIMFAQYTSQNLLRSILSKHKPEFQQQQLQQQLDLE
jgi:hypothetical protein